MNSITVQNLSYANAIILSNGKKNGESLGRYLNKSGDTVLRLLEQQKIDIDSLIFIAKKLFRGKKIYLVLDDTTISKEYSQLIEGTSDNFDSASGRQYRSLCSVVIMLTDGKYAIPLDHALWTREELMLPFEYKPKAELAKGLIEKVLAKMAIHMVVMDGLYASSDLIKWLSSKNIKFEMRFHGNRVIIPEETNSKYVIRDYFEQIMKKNIKYRSIKALWKDELLCFTAVKRTTKKGDQSLVFQVSNYTTSPRDHARIYSFRWNIEKFFRTCKQYLGLGECQSRKKVVQHNHITHVFLAYTLLQIVRKDRGLKNSEAAFHLLKEKNQLPSNYLNAFADQNFGVIYA